MTFNIKKDGENDENSDLNISDDKNLKLMANNQINEISATKNRSNVEEIDTTPVNPAQSIYNLKLNATKRSRSKNSSFTTSNRK